jgi:hypothetical protein
VLARRIAGATVAGALVRAASEYRRIRSFNGSIARYREDIRPWYTEMWDRDVPGPVVMFASWIALGAVEGAVYGVVRPALPRQPLIAGATFGACEHVALKLATRAIEKHYGLRKKTYAGIRPRRPVFDGLAATAEGAALGYTAARFVDLT